ALAAYAGAAIAQANPMKTAITATKLAIAAFIVPYIRAFNPIMVLEGTFHWWQVGQVVLTSLVGLFGIAACLNGNLFCKINPVFRLVLLAGGLMMMDPGLMTDLVGIIMVAVVSAVQFFLRKKHDAQAALPENAAQPALLEERETAETEA
ncbi:MAG: hypothetical protein IJC51_01150, partial [Eggerthellaceae bacterium]|nr:hypothetical protein [Eggerthellaceae bacterium]